MGENFADNTHFHFITKPFYLTEVRPSVNGFQGDGGIIPGLKRMHEGKRQYCIFKTSWGYFGLLADKQGLVRTCLPVRSRGLVQKYLGCDVTHLRYNKNLFSGLQDRIRAYYQGECIDFNDVECDFNGIIHTPFSSKVLNICKGIEFGHTMYYGMLARLAGSPGAARAVGNVLAKNQIPLIIPCHRVVCAGGRLGGFSAHGGVNMKRRMLAWEASRETQCKEGVMPK